MIGGRPLAWLRDVDGAGDSCEAGEEGERDSTLLQLRREKVVLLGDIGGLRAKFELTLEVLRAIFRLGADATWADLLEHGEALAQAHTSSAGAVQPDVEDAAEELRQAELECQRLEDELESQAAHIARLRRLLHKQQELLDMTAQQLEESQQQAERVVALEEQAASQRESLRAREDRIAALSMQCDGLRGELRRQHEATALQEAQVCSQASSIAALEAELARKDEALVSREAECERRRTDGDQDAGRARARIRELTESLSQRDDLAERLRAQLEVYEAAERRRHSYRQCGGAPASRGDPVGAAAAEDELSSVASCRQSARGSASELDGAQALPRGRGQGAAAQPASPKGPVALAPMDREERAAFLSHFPMASRTERHLRSRLDDMPGKPSATSHH